jgi:hypothetical protein
MLSKVTQLHTGRLMEWASLDCGHSVNIGKWEQVKTAAVGQELECFWCVEYTRALAELRDALAAGIVSHSRAGDRLSRGSVHVYRRESKSPTGVRLLVTIQETAEVLALLRGGLSPLSPTEAR